MKFDEKMLDDVLQQLHVPELLENLPHNVGATERTLSAVGGAALGLYGLKNKNSALGIIAGLVGGAMLFRSATGYCPVNQAIGRDSSNDG